MTERMVKMPKGPEGKGVDFAKITFSFTSETGTIGLGQEKDHIHFLLIYNTSGYAKKITTTRTKAIQQQVFIYYEDKLIKKIHFLWKSTPGPSVYSFDSP